MMSTRLVVLAGVWLSHVVAQSIEVGLDICHCQPDTITFDLKFDFVCPDSNVEGPGILDTACLVDTRGQSVSDRVPNVVTEVQVFELDETSAILNQAVYSGTFFDGHTITYTSIVKSEPERITSLESLPMGFQVTMSGINQFEEVLINTWIIQYTGDCGIFPLIEIGEQIGWSLFTNLGAPSTDFCPISPDDDETDAPAIIPTETPVVGPTEAPVVGPTEAPVVGPTEAPVTDSPAIGATGAPALAPTTDAPVVPSTDAPAEAPVVYPPHCPQYYDDDDDDSDSGKAGKGGSGKAGSESGKAGSGKGDSGKGKSGKGDSGKGKSGKGDSGKGKSGKGDSGKGKSGKGDSGKAGGMSKLPEDGMTESNSAKSPTDKSARHRRHLAVGSTLDDCPAPMHRGKGKAGGKGIMKVKDEGRTEDLSGKGKGGKGGKAGSMGSEGKSGKGGKGSSGEMMDDMDSESSGKGGKGGSSGKGGSKMISDMDGSDGYPVTPTMGGDSGKGGKGSSGEMMDDMDSESSGKGGKGGSSGKGGSKMISDMDGSDGYPVTPTMGSDSGKGISKGSMSSGKGSNGKGSMSYADDGSDGYEVTPTGGKGGSMKVQDDGRTEDVEGYGKGGTGKGGKGSSVDSGSSGKGGKGGSKTSGEMDDDDDDHSTNVDSPDGYDVTPPSNNGKGSSGKGSMMHDDIMSGKGGERHRLRQ